VVGNRLKLIGACWGLASTLACSNVSKPTIHVDGGTDAGGNAGKGSSSAGTNNDAGGTEAGGTDTHGGTAGNTAGTGTGDGGAPPQEACTEEGARRCSGKSPQECAKGVWESEESCVEACTGEGVCACTEGRLRCDGDTPTLCKNGEWVPQTPCGGTAKVCTGEGVCAAYRLLSGGIDALGKRPAETGNYVLKEQTLSAAPRVCGTDYCVTGGLR